MIENIVYDPFFGKFQRQAVSHAHPILHIAKRSKRSTILKSTQIAQSTKRINSSTAPFETSRHDWQKCIFL